MATMVKKFFKGLISFLAVDLEDDFLGIYKSFCPVKSNETNLNVRT